MIKSPDVVADFESREQAAIDRGRTYQQALAVFAALWAQARLLNPAAGADWMEDIKADIAVARALRGLPPAP